MSASKESVSSLKESQTTFKRVQESLLKPQTAAKLLSIPEGVERASTPAPPLRLVLDKTNSHKTKNAFTKLFLKLTSPPQTLETLTKELSPLSCLHASILKQFTDLREEAYYKWGESDASRQVIEFVEELMFLFEKDPEVAKAYAGNNLAHVLGELIYLIDKHPKKALLLTEKSSLYCAPKKIHEAFEMTVSNVHKKLNSLYEMQGKADLQNPILSKQIQTPVELASILIPTTGILNKALIPTLIREFVEEKTPSIAFANTLKGGLNLLAQSERIRSLLEGFHLPDPKDKAAHDLIRITLRLPKNVLLTDAHARRAILATLLTHLRQGKSGSCFASSFAILQQSVHPDEALEDFIALLRDGKLKRNVEGEILDFPYLIKIAKEDLFKKKAISTEGQILTPLKTKLPLNEVPGIVSVCNLIGIEDPKLFFQALHFDGKEISIGELIDQMCKLKQWEDLDMAYLAFESLSTNPLLRVWENALAGMAEGRNGSILKKALSQSVQYLLQKQGQTCLQEKIDDVLQKRARYLFDPAYFLGGKSQEQGAFVLYDSASWKRIDSPILFQEFIKSIADEAFDKCQKADVLKGKEAFIEEVSKETTLIKLLKKYHRENTLDSTTKGLNKELRFTPWVTLIGNDPKQVIQVYHETETPLVIEELKPHHAQELIEIIVGKLKTLPRKEDSVIPLRIQGVHAFTLLKNHPSFTSLIEDPSKIKNIQRKELTDGLIPPLMKTQLTNYVQDYLIPKYEIPQFLKKLEGIPSKISIKEYRRALTEAMSLLPSHHEKERKLDLKIIELLPLPLKKNWQKSLIHFADTNWEALGQDIHYAIGFNPGKGEIELMSVLEDGTPFEILNQGKFLKLHTWELYLPEN